MQDLISYPVDLFMSAVQRQLTEEAKQVLDERMQYCMDKGITDWGKIQDGDQMILSVILYGKRQRDVR